MKQLIKSISPTRFFRSRKLRSPRSDLYSSSCESSSSGFHNKNNDLGTPTSVLGYSSDIVQAFKIIDSDNDGFVSRTQLEALLSRLGGDPLGRDDVAAMLSEVDRDGDGCISVDALMTQAGSACELAGADDLRVAFEFFDTDRDGKITAEELVGVFKAIGDESCTLDDCRRMISGVDKNGDGIVCFEDFCRMMEP